MSKMKTQPYASVWDALADTAEEAANLKVRAELMRKIAALIQESLRRLQSESFKNAGLEKGSV